MDPSKKKLKAWAWKHFGRLTDPAVGDAVFKHMIRLTSSASLIGFSVLFLASRGMTVSNTWFTMAIGWLLLGAAIVLNAFFGFQCGWAIVSSVNSQLINQKPAVALLIVIPSSCAWSIASAILLADSILPFTMK